MASYPKPHPAFNPGAVEGEPGYIRIFDGHDPYEGGIEGANVHPGGDIIEVGDPVGLPVDEV